MEQTLARLRLVGIDNDEDIKKKVSRRVTTSNMKSTYLVIGPKMTRTAQGIGQGTAPTASRVWRVSGERKYDVVESVEGVGEEEEEGEFELLLGTAASTPIRCLRSYSCLCPCPAGSGFTIGKFASTFL